MTQNIVNGTPVTHVEGDVTWAAPGKIVQHDKIARFTVQRYVHLRNDLLQGIDPKQCARRRVENDPDDMHSVLLYAHAIQ